MYKGKGTFAGFVEKTQKAMNAISGGKVELPVGGESVEAPFFGINSGGGGFGLLLDLSEAPIFTLNNIIYPTDYTITSKSVKVENNRLVIRMGVTLS